MTSYDCFVEALGYGDVEAEVEALESALSELVAEDVKAEVLADDTRDMLMVHLTMDAVTAIDAHELTMTLWSEAWEAAFGGEHAPTERLAVRCVPAGVAAEATG